MKSRRNSAIMTFMLLCLAAAPGFLQPVPAHADDMAKAGREISGDWGNAVISVRTVAKIRVVVEGREVNKKEFETEAVATVIDPSGLTVLSLASIDATDILTEKLSQAGGENIPKFSIENELVDIKMLMPDGAEVPARIVLRDKDLDAAFIAPVQALSKAVTAVDLTRSAKPEVLDQFVLLARLGKAIKRIPSVSLYRIQAVVGKPRTYYVPDQTFISDKIGSAAFTPDGKIVGVLLLRNMKAQGMPANPVLGGNTLIPVIVPAEDIAEIARQVSKGEGDK